MNMAKSKAASAEIDMTQNETAETPPKISSLYRQRLWHGLSLALHGCVYALSALGRWVLRHWHRLIVSISVGIPALLALWVFFSFKIHVDPHSQAMSAQFSINSQLERFERLAILANVEPDSQPYLEVLADAAAEAHAIDPRLFRALVTQESAWQPEVVSSKGAAGLTQLMPATALEECGLKPHERFEPSKNLNCGAQYFAKQLRRFKSVDLALAAYNSGPARVAKLGRIPRIPETQNYVTRIMAHWNGSAS